MKRLLILLLLLGLSISLVGCEKTSVVWMEISPKTITLAPGESIQLSIMGYMKDNKIASDEQIEDLNPVWTYRTSDNAFTLTYNCYILYLLIGHAAIQ